MLETYVIYENKKIICMGLVDRQLHLSIIEQIKQALEDNNRLDVLYLPGNQVVNVEEHEIHNGVIVKINNPNKDNRKKREKNIKSAYIDGIRITPDNLSRLGLLREYLLKNPDKPVDFMDDMNEWKEFKRTEEIDSILTDMAQLIKTEYSENRKNDL